MSKRVLTFFVLVAGLAQGELKPLFDGETLDGWRIEGAPYWTVSGSVLIGESDAAKKNSILWTKKEYSDFTMEFEFRFSGRIDSGVFVRHPNEQIQIGVSGSLKRDMTASPYIANKRGYPVEATGVKELLKEGEWNKMKIVAKGRVYTVALNGKDVMTYESESARETGSIGLQVHPGLVMKVEFRNVLLAEIRD